MRRTDSWRCLGGDTRRCHYTDLSLSFPLYQRWSLQLLGSVDAQPVSDGNDIYVCSLAACHRIDLQSGEIVWQFPCCEPPGEQINAFKATPAIYQDRIYVTDVMGRLCCVHKDTGSLIWVNEKIGAYSVSVCIEQDHVFTSSRFKDRMGKWNKHFYCLDLEGNTRWWFEGNGFVKTDDGAIKDNILVIGGSDGWVYGIQIETGALIWQVNLNDYKDDFRVDRSREIAITGHPMITGNIVVLAVQDYGTFVGLDLFSGRVLWFHEAIYQRRGYKSVGWCVAASSSNLIYAMIDEIHVVDVKPGIIKYVHDISPYDLGSCNSYWGLIAGQHYIATYGMSRKIAAFNLETGVLDWEFEAQGQFSNAAAVIDRRLVFADKFGNIYCFSAFEA